MERLGPVVATLTLPAVRDALAAARAARASGADRVEVRLDLLAPGEDPGPLLALASEMPLLASGRRDAVNPGEIPLLLRAQELGAWVDVPFGGALPDSLFGLDRSRLVLSWHDAEGTPPDLPERLARMRGRAAVVKLVTTARDLPDLFAVKRLLEEEGGAGGLCAFAMGPAGFPSRILGPAWGSAATYAAAPGCPPAAPGQPSLEDLLGLYRVRSIGPQTPLYALAGWPLATTRSPALFNPWLKDAGLSGRYLPFPCSGPEILLGEPGLPLWGVAVTVPHKEAILAYCQATSRLVRTLGAANTLLPLREGGWLAANTDAFGVRRALAGVPRGSRCLLLGAGGAAAAAAAALRSVGPCAVAARKPRRAEAFARRFGMEAVPWEKRSAAPWDLLVNATPVGGDGRASPYPAEALNGTHVLDMVVRPGGTALLRAAAERGLEVYPGEAMLVPQARLQFRLWTGRRPRGYTGPGCKPPQ
jgi:shikimate dehydrogenase